jgi:hypothetical protein
LVFLGLAFAVFPARARSIDRYVLTDTTTLKLSFATDGISETIETKLGSALREISTLSGFLARMPVPKFVCEVAYASGFAWSMHGDVSWDTRRIVRKARPNSIALEKGSLGTHMRASRFDTNQ